MIGGPIGHLAWPALRLSNAEHLGAPEQAVPAVDNRPCSCHPDDAPKPCTRRHALGECQATARELALRGLPDYAAMGAGELFTAVGDDAAKWAAAFAQHAVKLGYPAMDLAWLTGWFANAIEVRADHKRWRGYRGILATIDPATASLLERASSKVHIPETPDEARALQWSTEP